MTRFWSNDPGLEHELQLVRQVIRSTIEDSHPFIRDILSPHLEAGGKMLRPALALITSRMGETADRESAIRIAAVLEMIHMASLVHDDIIDTARTRRGVPTVYALHGPKKAVLAGDYLLARAMALVGGQEGDLEASVVSTAFSRLCQSELEQDASLGDFSISKRTYLRRIAGKTASLFALSCYAGAAVSRASVPLQMCALRIGYAMGMAFQIQDDVLDYTGSASTMGKQTGIDLRCGIPTLPLLEALAVEQTTAKDGKGTLHELLGSSKPLGKRDVGKAVALVVALGGVKQALCTEQLYMSRALKDINKLGKPEVASTLSSLFERLSIRAA